MMKSKYGAKKVIIDNIKFDSKAEGDYYLYLKKLKEKGEIENIICHPRFTLLPKYNKNMAITYIADFQIEYTNGNIVVVDVKGMPTEVAKIKKKMFDYYHRDKELIWIAQSKKYGNEYGFIEYKELEKIRKENRKAKKNK